MTARKITSVSTLSRAPSVYTAQITFIVAGKSDILTDIVAAIGKAVAVGGSELEEAGIEGVMIGENNVTWRDDAWVAKNVKVVKKEPK